MSRFVQEPCKMLNPKRVVAGDVFAGTANGNSCAWRGKKDRYPSYTATVEPAAKNLESLYRRRTEFRMFEPTVVTGFPAVFIDAERATADRGHCTISVGVADDSAITVTATISDSKSPDYEAPCTQADLFAHDLVGSIKSGNA